MLSGAAHVMGGYMRRVVLLLYAAVVLALAAGCAYTGPVGIFDFSSATSLEWLVSVTNHQSCRQRPWDSISAFAGNRESQSRQCRDLGFMDCGQGSPAGDPEVIYDETANRFWYVSMPPSRHGACLSSAPAADPWAVDRQIFLRDTQFGSDLVDRIMVAASSNKVAVSIWNQALINPGSPDAFKRITLVLNKAEFLNGQGVHTARIVHDLPGESFSRVQLVPSIGTGGEIAWFTMDVGRVKIGMITGVPGHGDVNTMSTALNRPWTSPGFNTHFVGTPVPGTSVDVRYGPRAVLEHGSQGAITLWVAERISVNGRWAVGLEHYNNLGPTFNPQITMYRTFPSQGHQICPSLAVGSDNRALLSWTLVDTNVWPTIEMVAVRLNGQVQRQAPMAGTPGFFASGPRVDYCPQGARYVVPGDISKGTLPEEWLTVGVNTLLDTRPDNRNAPDMTLFSCRQDHQNGGNICRGW
jgi:hypothetical protein